MALPDIFPLGIALEGLAARASGAGPDWDAHQLRDVEIHMATYHEHQAGARVADLRGDWYNGFVERADAALNLFFAWVVAQRIEDPASRERAFALVNS